MLIGDWVWQFVLFAFHQVIAELKKSFQYYVVFDLQKKSVWLVVLQFHACTLYWLGIKFDKFFWFVFYNIIMVLKTFLILVRCLILKNNFGLIVFKILKKRGSNLTMEKKGFFICYLFIWCLIWENSIWDFLNFIFGPFILNILSFIPKLQFFHISIPKFEGGERVGRCEGERKSSNDHIPNIKKCQFWC